MLVDDGLRADFANAAARNDDRAAWRRGAALTKSTITVWPTSKVVCCASRPSTVTRVGRRLQAEDRVIAGRVDSRRSALAGVGVGGDDLRSGRRTLDSSLQSRGHVLPVGRRWQP